MTKTATTKKPNIESAAVTARTISRLLKKSGFTMLVKDEYGSSGYAVHRIGVGNTVAVYWRCENEHWYNSKHKEERRQRLGEVCRFLVERGYPVDEKGYLECESE